MSACPDCQKPLRELQVGTTELFGCACGSAWFPFERLEKVLARKLTYEALGGETERRCPDCTLSLTTVLILGNVPVETCSACRGVFLDWPDVVDVAGRSEQAPGSRAKELERKLRPAGEQRYAAFVTPDEPAPPNPNGFVCPACGGRFPYAQGSATSRGLLCSGCAPQVQAPPPVPDVVVDAFGVIAELDDE